MYIKYLIINVVCKIMKSVHPHFSISVFIKTRASPYNLWIVYFNLNELKISFTIGIKSS